MSDLLAVEKSYVKKEERIPVKQGIIRGTSVSIYSFQQMEAIAKVKVSRLLSTKRKDNGEAGSKTETVNDNNFGSQNANAFCPLCNLLDCPGHYGLLKLLEAIYNPFYIRLIVSILTCVCNCCGDLLVDNDVIYAAIGTTKVLSSKQMTKVEGLCKGKSCSKDKKCKLNPIYNTKDLKETGIICFMAKGDENDENSRFNPMNLSDVEKILAFMTSRARATLGFNKDSNPLSMIMKGILIPPVVARPPGYVGGKLRDDRITIAYDKLVESATRPISEKYGYEDRRIAVYKQYYSIIYKNTKSAGTKDLKTISERLQGKHAIMRGTLMGKRNDRCARTVAGPDESLSFGQIRIPRSWQTQLTKDEKVTTFNKSKLDLLLREGQIVNIIPRTGISKPAKSFAFLRIGDTVKRFLRDGDRVTTNRQPNLHKYSLMAYTVVLGDQSTIGLHISYTTPLNCDFDGDENNCWCPQDLEVEAECEIIMNVVENIMSLEQNKPSMALVMNSITGAYLMCQDNVVLDDSLVLDLLSQLKNRSTLYTLNERLRKYNVDIRTGRGVMSSLFPSSFSYYNGDVRIVEGVLVAGYLTKSQIGTTHRSIVQDLHKTYGSERTAEFLTDAPHLIGRWLVETGFTVGMKDVINIGYDEEGNEVDLNKQNKDKEIAEAVVKTRLLSEGTVSSEIERGLREQKIREALDIARVIGGRIATGVLQGDNSLKAMTDVGGGGKGNKANIGAMIGSLGQVFFQGERLRNDITGKTRASPYFIPGDKDPRARGLIISSYLEGLQPYERFAEQQAGREALMDISMKTPEAGDMNRKLNRALENIIVAADGSVRNTTDYLFSTSYGIGVEPQELLKIGGSGVHSISFIDLKSVALQLRVADGWIEKSVLDDIKKRKKPTMLKLPSSLLTGEAEKITPRRSTDPRKKISLFERARVIGTRATQLSNNHPPRVDIGDETDPIKIAMMELTAGYLTDLVVRRPLFGTFEDVILTQDRVN